MKDARWNRIERLTGRFSDSIGRKVFNRSMRLYAILPECSNHFHFYQLDRVELCTPVYLYVRPPPPPML